MAGGNWLSEGLDHQPGALITGGSVGLGLAMARELLRQGFAVSVCARTQSDLDAARALEPALQTIRADVASAADRGRLMAEVEQRLGRPLDCLVNNAAIVRAHDYANPFTLEQDRAGDEIAINFAAPVDLCRLFLKSRMDGAANGPGAILNVSTPGAFFPLDANPLYCPSSEHSAQLAA